MWLKRPFHAGADVDLQMMIATQMNGAGPKHGQLELMNKIWTDAIIRRSRTASQR
jgi:hypothetical protein